MNENRFASVPVPGAGLSERILRLSHGELVSVVAEVRALELFVWELSGFVAHTMCTCAMERERGDSEPCLSCRARERLRALDARIEASRKR